MSAPARDPRLAAIRQRLESLVAQWRAAARQADVWAAEADAKHDGANSHAFRKERRIWTTCADELQGLLGSTDTDTSDGSSPRREGWQDIATAPKDGTRVLVYCHKGGISAAVWPAGTSYGWLSVPGSYAIRPTHWRPLPAPPSAEATDVGIPSARIPNADVIGRSFPALPALSISESVGLLKEAIDRANTPDGPHPFLFDTLSLHDAKRILGAWADAGLVDGPRGYALAPPPGGTP